MTYGALGANEKRPKLTHFLRKSGDIGQRNLCAKGGIALEICPDLLYKMLFGESDAVFHVSAETRVGKVSRCHYSHSEICDKDFRMKAR